MRSVRGLNFAVANAALLTSSPPIVPYSVGGDTGGGNGGVGQYGAVPIDAGVGGVGVGRDVYEGSSSGSGGGSDRSLIDDSVNASSSGINNDDNENNDNDNDENEQNQASVQAANSSSSSSVTDKISIKKEKKMPLNSKKNDKNDKINDKNNDKVDNKIDQKDVRDKNKRSEKTDKIEKNEMEIESADSLPEEEESSTNIDVLSQPDSEERYSPINNLNGGKKKGKVGEKKGAKGVGGVAVARKR